MEYFKTLQFYFFMVEKVEKNKFFMNKTNMYSFY